MQLDRIGRGDARFNANSIPHFQDVRERSGSVFSGVAAWSFVSVSLMAQDEGSAFDPRTSIGVPLVLIGVTALATFGPARRAARVDPGITMRAEKPSLAAARVAAIAPSLYFCGHA